ncbi:SusD/RagB family nutrient-binding outer membrane lipoprotein [Luteirhabdus pelagi]|uniref:SusD/RagB family nutrient-binding outer membrane lipoprotein n=1 Tax=Luteirhabdus pelagi TaxID=2792783 RepID=UPI00193AAEA7|nr:SusD/RagB family nutrient-binding outer membrane lipoprotein [Luteirhabdus pelagi]
MIKKIILICLGIFFVQCSDDLEGLNEDEKAFNEVPGETLMTNGQRNMVDQLVNTNVNLNVFRLFAQYWGEATYTDEANYNIVTRSIPENHWNIMYRDVLKDLDEAYRLIEAQEIVNVSPSQFEEDTAIKANKLAIIEVQRVLAYQILVDTFADIPYSEALDVDIINPSYDDDEAIYNDLISRLNTAIGNINTSFGSFGGQDLIYNGNTSSWLALANSIKLRMGMRIADVDPAQAAELVSSASSNIIDSNSENATIEYLSATPNTNPLWIDLVQTNRRDFVPADTFVNRLNDLEDPRRPIFLADPIDGEYIGAPYGSTVSYDSYSHIGDIYFTQDLEGLIFDAAESHFLLAEAVERGFIAGDAEALYEQAIRLNMEYWGVESSDIDSYISQSDVDYATAEGDYKQKIGVQKWIALYNRGFEGWTEYRRLDYPQLEAPEGAQSDIVPLRFTYPVIEQNLNSGSYNAAASAIGGDELTTPVFWDVNN